MAFGKTFTPAGEQMAQHLAGSGGTLTPLHHGLMFKFGYGEWNISNPWRGRELTIWKARKSLWDKGIHIVFGSLANASEQDLASFKLTLQPPLSDEDIAQTADTYMMILNMRRVE